MKILIISSLLILGIFVFARRIQAQEAANSGAGQSVYDFKVKTMDGERKKPGRL